MFAWIADSQLAWAFVPFGFRKAGTPPADIGARLLVARARVLAACADGLLRPLK
jgi:hypothetical protein